MQLKSFTPGQGIALVVTQQLLMEQCNASCYENWKDLQIDEK